MFVCFPAALKDYLKFNNCLPTRIIVYRDGVGDGQLHSVVNYEIAQIMDSIKSMGHDYMQVYTFYFYFFLFSPDALISKKRECVTKTNWGKTKMLMSDAHRPKVSVVVVTKRISTRFFHLLRGKVSNPPPGTVIDTEVTRPEWYVLGL